MYKVLHSEVWDQFNDLWIKIYVYYNGHQDDLNTESIFSTLL